MYGAGFAYEVSPSFDVRVEYRALVTKVPTFGETNANSGYDFTTHKWYNISVPTVGVAYHF
jgi:opacity protein-like surface antigen